LRAVPKEVQRPQNPLDRLLAGEKTAFNPDRVGGKREPDGGNARGRPLAGVVGHQTVGGVGFVQKVSERAPLELVDLFIFQTHASVRSSASRVEIAAHWRMRGNIELDRSISFFCCRDVARGSRRLREFHLRGLVFVSQQYVRPTLEQDKNHCGVDFLRSSLMEQQTKSRGLHVFVSCQPGDALSAATSPRPYT
jgi:hypothetical protein